MEEEVMGTQEPTRSHKKLIALVAIVVVVLIAVGLGTWFEVKSHADSVAAEAHSKALSACVKQSKALDTAKADYTAAVAADDVQAALEVTAKQVADPATVDALSEATGFTASVAGTCSTKDSTDQLTKLGGSAQATSEAYTGSTGKIPAAAQAVMDSKAEKDDADALAVLDAEITTATALLSSSNGKTASDTERQALTTEIQTAQKVATDKTKRAKDYNAETAKLKAAEKKVTDAVSAKAKADKKAADAKAQAQHQQSYSGGSSGSHSGGSSSSGSKSGGSGSGGYVQPNFGEGMCGTGGHTCLGTAQ